jgi:hypothetical protein
MDIAEAENILKDSQFASVRVVDRWSAAMAVLTDIACHLEPMITTGCESIVKPR